MRGVREIEAVHGAQLDAQRTDEALGVRLAEAERRLEHEDVVVRTVDGGEDVMHVFELTAQPARLPRYNVRWRYDTAYLLTRATVTMAMLTCYGHAHYGDTHHGSPAASQVLCSRARARRRSPERGRSRARRRSARLRGAAKGCR